MITIKADMCDSCKEIYNKENLKKIEIGGNYCINLCRGCYIAFYKRYMEREGAINE